MKKLATFGVKLKSTFAPGAKPGALVDCDVFTKPPINDPVPKTVPEPKTGEPVPAPLLPINWKFNVSNTPLVGPAVGLVLALVNRPVPENGIYRL